jgi:hypothetical protein
MSGYYSGGFVRTVTARERVVLWVAGTVLSALKDSHGTGNSVINALGKAMNGLSEYSVCPRQRLGTHTLRNQAVTQLEQRGSRPSARSRLIPAQTNGPTPEERARGDTQSLASRVYPGQPG